MHKNLIYKDNKCHIFVDFYERPAVIELNYDNNIVKIDVNGEYIEGNKDLAFKLTNWFKDCKKEFYDIVWEWKTGNDDFDLINIKINL